MTTTKAELYHVLLDMRDSERAILEQLENAKQIDAPGTGYSNHQADDATMVYDQTVNASAFNSVKNRLREIEESIARHEAGTYGICENCEDEIDIARLEALPYTSLCMRCAELRDFRAGM